MEETSPPRCLSPFSAGRSRNRSRPCEIALPFLFVVLAAAMGGAAQAQVNRRHTETLLAPFSPEVYDSAVVSPDGRRIAYVEQAGDRQAAVIDGNREQAYDRVAALTFSPNGKWHAYAASAGGRWLLVVNGREQPACARVGRPKFSPNSGRLAYVALPAEGQPVSVVEVTQPPGKSYDEIFDGRIVFSPDSRRMAYGARSDGKWWMVVDGRQTGPYDYLGSASGIVFSADGNRVAFAALAGKKWNVIADGRPQKTYDNLADVVFSPDGKRLAYAACSGDRWQAVVDGQEQGPFDAIGEGTLRFSPDGAKLTYAARSGQKWHVVVDGTPGDPYDGIGQMLFSPDGRSLAYAAKTGDTESVVLNDRLQKATEQVVLKDRLQKAFDEIGGGTLVFSPDGRRLGYVARVGRAAFAVIDDARQRRYDMVGYLNFTPDGRHYVYAGTSGAAAFTVVDGQEAADRYDAIWNVPEAKFLFDSRLKFHYMGIKQGKIYLVEEEVE